MRKIIQIMKASAGSGKTFNLARKYITLLFRKKERYPYRHILAVTFTNKATDEMKNRILKELYVLSTDPSSSGYLKWFMPEMFSVEQLEGTDPDDFVKELPGQPGIPVTLEGIRECAGEMLCNILHDYSAFSISTIDRFFQQTLKAFSREIGQFSSYQVELDKDSLIAETVDRIFDSLTEDSGNHALLRWLTDCAIEQVENGGGYDITGSLVKMASRLKSDQHRDLVAGCGIDEIQVCSYENLQKIRGLCRSVMADFIEKTRTRAKAATEAMESCGLVSGDFYRSFPKVLYSYSGMDGNSTVEAPGTFLSRGRDPELWFSKAVRKTNMEKSRGLETSFGAFCSLFDDEFKVYNTARIVYDQLYELGLSADINREFDAVLKDNNVLGIDDSNRILKNIIDGSDAPFVYEKTGVRYENFLLDEFQDTSGIQWENFRPLLEESRSKGFESLIVGDVKQSIYRWRGSEWKLLHESLEKELSGCYTTVLDSVGPGEIFAETYACTPDEPLMVNAVAAQGTQVLFLEIERVLRLCPSACRHHSGLLRNLLALSAQKNLNLSRKIFHTSPKTIRGRLLSYLSEQAIRSNSSCICLPFNRQQLADYLNVDRSALSNELGKMAQDGLIRVEKNRFWLLDGQLPAERG